MSDQEIVLRDGTRLSGRPVAWEEGGLVVIEHNGTRYLGERPESYARRINNPPRPSPAPRRRSSIRPQHKVVD